MSNDILSYSSACTFGFLFSFIPTIMIILVILLRFLHASPDTIINLISETEIFSSTVNISDMVSNILAVKKIGSFEIVLGLGIMWMARRFFSSVMAGMNAIYKSAVKSKPVVNQIIIFAGEAVMVIASSVIIFLLMSFRTIKRTQFLTEILSDRLVKIATSRLINTLPIIILFVVVLALYKEMSTGRPTWKASSIAASFCTVTFWLFQRLMSIFGSMYKYNIVYGVLSNVVILLLDVSFFFLFFFFFAQYLFVYQYFDELLLGELYVLPDRDETSLFPSIKRLLFIRPDYLLHETVNVIHLKKGEYVYRTNEEDDGTYYIAHGAVQILRHNNISFAERGDFFGEQACILNETRKEDVTAYTDVELVRIDSKTFLSLLDKNPEAGRKALSQISSYYAKVFNLREPV